MSIIQTAISGLLAQSRALGGYAQNVANMQTTGKLNPQSGDKAAYIPVDPVQISGPGNAPQTVLRDVDPATTPVYDPDSVDANADGMIAAPNVNLEEQIVGAMMAKTVYTANAKLIKIQDELDKALLDIIS